MFLAVPVVLTGDVEAWFLQPLSLNYGYLLSVLYMPYCPLSFIYFLHTSSSGWVKDTTLIPLSVGSVSSRPLGA